MVWRRAPLALIITVLAVAAAFGLADRPHQAVARIAAVAAAIAGAMAVQARLYSPVDQPTGAAGRAELRLLGVWLLTLLFAFILALLFFVVILSIGYAVASAGPGFNPSKVSTWAPALDARGRAVLGGVFAIGALGMGWTMARVSLAPPASLVRGKTLMLSSWPLTYRSGWPILAAGLLLATPPVILLYLLATARDGQGLGLRWIVDLARGAVIGGLWLPLHIGLVDRWHGRALEQFTRDST